MKIISWNVNGLRANIKKGAWDEIMANNPDILCIQETKARPEQLPPEYVSHETYHSYFTWPEHKKGYSGVAIYTKIKPNKVLYGLSGIDDEGRMIALFFPKWVLCNVYFPNGGGGPHRIEYKLKYYEKFLKFIEKIRKTGKRVVFCGDINTAHTEIDLARPKENVGNTGFLPEERAWIDKVIDKGYIDVFRCFYPNKKEVYTYWDMKTFARDRNVGWRIDYFFVSPETKKFLKSFKTHSKIYGSDHCPIELEIDV